MPICFRLLAQLTRRAFSMWMRGANLGDTVEVAISFRNQDGGGEPNAPMQ